MNETSRFFFLLMRILRKSTISRLNARGFDVNREKYCVFEQSFAKLFFKKFSYLLSIFLQALNLLDVYLESEFLPSSCVLLRLSKLKL